ncbi:MAG TPA: hypothetical protein PKA28_18650 [Methylomusa anaerophila]|uniref:Uncharacterized protein n=1 Tax=Methylomusa anaerophila TaxID=1930071 RepID=A0A348AE84_9FIRM|nr:hypothetical protein [Methylomusa anaerophila]BBB89382.1 hypothetical protein MAMMFC1_00015 [Methylomusa anaerophila]HML90458.1 hypothetical protein [Methylomusa anaerophila]
MSEADKQLAVNLTIAIIAANPRTTYIKTAGGVETLVPSLSIENIGGLVKHYYTLLKSLDNDSDADKELAVNLTIAVIAANPRTTYIKTAGGVEVLVPSLSIESIDGLVKCYYTLLKSLDSDSDQQ